jgi:hypothetical protein
MQATGTLAIQVLRYSFRIINWHHEGIQKLARKARKILTIHGQHNLGKDTNHLYIPQKEGGRGLMQTEGTYIKVL